MGAFWSYNQHVQVALCAARRWVQQLRSSMPTCGGLEDAGLQPVSTAVQVVRGHRVLRGVRAISMQLLQQLRRHARGCLETPAEHNRPSVSCCTQVQQFEGRAPYSSSLFVVSCS
jgi:hypothetical protein